jgi:hypothetical protein
LATATDGVGVCEVAAFLASILAALGLGEKREIERGCKGFL